ncbi:hypothetical protein BDFB_013851 [Asbolus verrucosus]|uniref:Uncharacterized protein n=1 Tax=Asbolus verrucosus TaxID=1661398 RepID=A0A482V2U2_ASBVE|nr:hypothetical protein BDFB_013851 [Asbolus verrucosus]
MSIIYGRIRSFGIRSYRPYLYLILAPRHRAKKLKCMVYRDTPGPINGIKLSSMTNFGNVCGATMAAEETPIFNKIMLSQQL